MKEQSYKAMIDAVKSSPFMEKYIVWFNRLITTTIYLLYPGLLVLLFLRSRIAGPEGADGDAALIASEDAAGGAAAMSASGNAALSASGDAASGAALSLGEGLIPAILIPGISFVLLSMVRHMINAPRPYEVFDIEPIINKKTAGHSLPSRHIFSIFVIATTVFYYYPIAGVLIGLTGVALAMNRVMGGVHFIRDVVTGALTGIGCGLIGFYVILPLVVG